VVPGVGILESQLRFKSASIKRIQHELVHYLVCGGVLPSCVGSYAHEQCRKKCDDCADPNNDADALPCRKAEDDSNYSENHPEGVNEPIDEERWIKVPRRKKQTDPDDDPKS
jgi:hypothetical protein